ncbi:MAG: transposase [Porticoccaceae bacterium]
MVDYRRVRVAGGTYFFTLALHDRRADTLVSHIDALKAAVRETRTLRPFRIDAMVVLPDHLHAVWTLPAEDADYSARWRAIKALFVRNLRAAGTPLTPNTKGEYKVWQRRFWEHLIRDENDLQRHVDYVHINPVKHGLVTQAREWPWSSFHRFVREGVLTADWASAPETTGSFGE